ncbi:PREDICTED: G kinase-anchoring protein 1-like [Papilio xuthus]|uniref:G kinase-anchoring protein 1-like n=1 Tax=Papilio xuthus TaxID=66420 RepID=A0AAJ7EAY5_PAPXU|nr:PREDICTED: G kinase-anchoring protein 1-like [Papilio xuthus]
MAALIVQSRFAGLNIEDDDFPTSSSVQKPKKTKVENNKKCEVPKKPKANGNKSQNANKKKKQKANGATPEQWEQWKEKDVELVDGNFETELQQAILLSKLDYEEKKDVYKQLKKDAQMEKKTESIRVNNKKMKKKNVMSLDQFNGMVNPAEDVKIIQNDEVAEEEKCINKDTEFFERIKDDTKNELLREKIIDRIKNQNNASDEVLTRVQFADALDKKNQEIAALREELVTLKKELHTVKTRNKKLCNILGQGEMKDKAELLIDVERLHSVNSELTAELASLHSDLEKERSRNTDTKSRDKKYPNKKKSIRFDVSSEALVTKEAGCGPE